MVTVFLRSLSALLLAALLSAPAAAANRISAEAWVSHKDPYVNESILYNVRVYSTGAIRSIELSPPSAEGVSIEELDGPVTGSKNIRGSTWITNDFHFVLTPMKAGPIEIGPARLIVKPAVSQQPWGGYRPGWSQDEKSAEVSTDRISLQAQPPLTGGQTWMPLQYLEVKTHWVGDDKAEAGEPVTLTVVMKARGAKGDQLPSVAPFLEGTDFKVYPERPQSDWKLTGGGAYLWGRRVETFTLVPTREGGLSIPAMDIPWWDVSSQKPNLAKVPPKLVLVGNAARKSGIDAVAESEYGLRNRLFSKHALYYFALPVGGGLLGAFLFGWWLGAGQPVKRRLAGAGGMVLRVLGAVLSRVGALLGQLARKLLPSRLRARALELVRRWAGGARETAGLTAMRVLPVRTKAWWCTRCINSENEPAGLCTVLRRFACENLAMSSNAPLQAIAERIVIEHPEADADSMRSLFRELDDAVYAGKPLDVRSWKHAFRRGFRRTFARKARTARPARPQGLPELNP